MIYSEQNDETLVSLTLLGETRAYEALVIRYERAVVGAAKSVAHNAYLAEDAAQDAFVSAWMKLDALREPSRFGAWVCKIARNRAKNLAVRYREYISFDLLENKNLERIAYTEEAIERPDNAGELRDSVRRLSEKVRQVIELHYFEGLSVDEIAERLRLPVGTVKWRLYDGRLKLRKGYGIMDEKETDTLVEKVMKKVEQLKLWRLYKNKDGFTAVYEDTLRDVECLPECEEKHRALADVLMHGYWWLPGEKDDALMERIRDAAERGYNEDVMEFLITSEENKLSGKDKITFILNKQIPKLEAMGFTQALGREWFRLGYEYFHIGENEAGYAAYDKVLEILKPSDVYYANAIAAIHLEHELLKCKPDNNIASSATCEVFKYINGKLRLWSQTGYSNNNIRFDNRSDNIFYYSSLIDRLLYDPKLEPDNSNVGTDGKSSITFAEIDVAAETSCGTFDGCELWITETDHTKVKTYFKRDIGIVRMEIKDYGMTSVRTLKNYKINGGEGIVPFAEGNRWEYTMRFDGNSIKHENIFEVTSFDGTTAVLWHMNYTHRLQYDENSWDDMMLRMRNEYYTKDGNALSSVEHYMLRAEELANTKYQKVHTMTACDVMRRIFATDSETNPDCKAKGHWNFFCFKNPEVKQGKTTLIYNQKYSFEWKDMVNVSEPGRALLHNDIYGILSSAVNCIWFDDWRPGTQYIFHDKNYGENELNTTVCVSDAGTITTAAGTFENCLLVALDITDNVDGGWRYRTGKKEFYFAPGVGIIRSVGYFKNDEIKTTYDLTSYSGTGEGYMPIEDGMVRHYDAVRLTDGYVGAAEYTYCRTDDGDMVILENRTGIHNLQ